MSPKAILDLLKETFSEWQEDNASRMAAALAYYTVFSLAPVLIIAIAIASAVLGEKAVRGEIFGSIQGVVGPNAAEFIQNLIANANRQGSGLAATIIGVVTLLFGASGVFAQLQSALNTAWEVVPKPGRGIMGTIKDRLLSFAMLLGIGFLLIVSLGVSTALSGIGKFLINMQPAFVYVSQAVNFAVSFAMVTFLFAMIYRFLPDAEIAWDDVWIGAAVTSFLFMIGTFLIGLYLGNRSIGSAYGAAGSLVVVLVWIYYSAQILFFGAEFTQVYARKHDSQIAPDRGAVRIAERLATQPAMQSPTAAGAAGRGKSKRPAIPSPPDTADQTARFDREPYLAGLFTMGAGLIVFVVGLVIEAVRGRRN